MNYSRKDVGLACLAAFVAWGLAVKLLPVLRYLGYAFNLGALSVLIGLTYLVVSTSRPRPALLVSKRPNVPGFLSPSNWTKDKANYLDAQVYNPPQLYPESLAVSKALDSLIGTALNDFISSWYTNISKSSAFVNEVDKNIRIALVGLVKRVQNEDIINAVVSRIIPVITLHFRNFDLAEKIVRGKSLSRDVTESEELDMAIAAKYRDGHLHSTASLAYSDVKSMQQEHLRKLLIRILPEIMPESMMKSRAVSVLVKEIVSCAVLFPIIQMLTDPDTWSQIIEAYGRTTLQDRKTVKRMRAALDEHASPTAKKQVILELPRLKPNDSERAFERFVRTIRKTKTLSDARRFRSQITSQLAKESLVEDQDPIYIRRLEMAKRVLEQKIAKLSNTVPTFATQVAQSEARASRAVRPRELTLTEIMHTASGLSYFMEFMDRQKRMALVQFWIVVDGVRNPLEDDFGDDTSSTSYTTWTDTDRMDIAQISETYISRPELKVPKESQAAIREFLIAGRKATVEQYRGARIAILSAQSAVLEELEAHHFPQFRKSDLYFKFLSTDDAKPKSMQPVSDFEHVDRAPLATVRSSSQPASKVRDLRRAALSSSDINSLATPKTSEVSVITRKSIDSGERAPLFDDGYDTDPLAHSTYSLGPESVNGDNQHQDEVIENMEAALTDIMANNTKEDSSDDEQDTLFGPPTVTKSSKPIIQSQTPSEMSRAVSPSSEKQRPSLATLGLVNTAGRIGVFSDNDLFPDEEKFLEDEYADQDVDDKSIPEDEIHAAAPGDLGLAEAITILTHDIERLVSQESVVDALTRKAELTNNVTELRILSKSRASLQREIRRKELQRQQYIVQESDNSLYGRSSIRINSVMVGKEDDGREFALYVVEVQRQAGDQMPAATWAIARRYSEFHELYLQLRRRYPSTRNLEFPRRRMVMKLQKQFLHNRRIALEAYLQQLLRMPDVCRSRELRSFLSQQAILNGTKTNRASDTQDIVTRIYNSVTDGMDDFIGNIAVLDQLSVAGQNLISAATGQMATNASGEVISISPGPIAEAEAEINAFEDKELEPFVKPICDIFLEIFELNRGNNWLRGRAVVVVLHQLLGGTVERKIREVFRTLFLEASLLKYIDQAKETIWPSNLEGKRKVSIPRTPIEKARTKKEADVMLASLIPDLAGSVVGRANAQAAARRIMATMNNKRLNEHLVMTIFDEIVAVLFGKGVVATAGNTGGGSMSATRKLNR